MKCYIHKIIYVISKTSTNDHLCPCPALLFSLKHWTLKIQPQNALIPLLRAIVELFAFGVMFMRGCWWIFLRKTMLNIFLYFFLLICAPKGYSAKCTSLCLLAGIIFLFSKIFLNKRRINQSLCDGFVCSLNQEISVREVVWIWFLCGFMITQSSLIFTSKYSLSTHFLHA